MRIGVQIPRFDFAGGPTAIAPVLTQTAQAADLAGIDVLSAMDHYFQIPYVGPVEQPMLEGYTTLAFLAAHCTRPELQLLVTGVTYRNPGILAKTVSTLDVLSAGRARLGIGAAWFEREHHGLGVPFPPLRDRFELLEETLQIVRQMWSDDDGPYTGARFQLAETLCRPQPLRRVPVMIGGMGERKSLRLVAQYGDACNLFADADSGPLFVAGKLEVLRGHCQEVGRTYADIRRTVLWTPGVDPDAPRRFLEPMRALADVGVEEVHISAGQDPVGLVRGLGDHVVPVLSGL